MENALSAQYIPLDLRLKLSTAAMALVAAETEYSALRLQFGKEYRRSRDAAGSELHVKTVAAGTLMQQARETYDAAVTEVANFIVEHRESV